MKKIIFLFIGILPFAVVFSCKHEPILDNVPEISFSNDILPLIQSNCQHSGCHDTTGYGPFPLIDYQTVMDNGDIEAGSPEDSKLYELITDPDPADRMPQPPYEPLSERNIKLIYFWIAQGAKNN
ncbi:MAG TPA: hypothetical protein VI731_00725 [Bacteroidia bacterium]|nr:hypothetical protein [Bacteroidia bacterium]